MQALRWLFAGVLGASLLGGVASGGQARLAVRTLTCTDGLLAKQDGGEVSVGSITLDLGSVCDADRACDGTCRFAFTCPLQVYSSAGYLPDTCRRCPSYVQARVRVGHRRRLKLRAAQTKLVLRCEPAPSGMACRRTTTTTTIPSECQTDTDCLRFPEPCRTCVEDDPRRLPGHRLCTTPRPPGLSCRGTDGGCVVCIPLITTTTVLPAVCTRDADCNLRGITVLRPLDSQGVAGCVQLDDVCGYCLGEGK
jgi:hypothetical protein